MTSLRLFSLLALTLCLVSLDTTTAGTPSTADPQVQTTAGGGGAQTTAPGGGAQTTAPGGGAQTTGAGGAAQTTAAGGGGQNTSGDGGSENTTLSGEPGRSTSLQSSLFTAFLLFTLSCLFQLLH